MTALAPAADDMEFATLAFASEAAGDAAEAEALIDAAFGPGRFAKTAERLREGNHLASALSVCAFEGGRLVGVARQWPILIGERPAIFLGPFAVAADWRRRGLGSALIRRAGGLADDAGVALTLLVGDLPFFGPLGYQSAPAERVLMPGPVDPRRLLWRPGPGADLSGFAGAVRVPGN